MGEPVSRAARRGCTHGFENLFHALFLQFWVILWSIYTNIKILFIYNRVGCTFKAQGLASSQSIEPPPSAEGPEWSGGLGKVR